MPRRTLALLLGLILASGAFAAPPAPEPESPPAAPAAAAPAPARVPPNPATPPAPKISFRPSETISEDTAVPFPADI